MANLDLTGSAFITGAGSGIGRQVAHTLQRHGVKQFALVDISTKGLKASAESLQAQHSDVHILQIEVDTTKEDAVSKAVQQAASEFGRVDYAINAAGITGELGLTEDMSFSAWQQVIAVNLTGVWLCQREEIKQMLKQEPREAGSRHNRGVIVNLASMLGLIAAPAAATHYGASKHAVVGATRTDGVYYATQNIRINAVCPGYIDTPMLTEGLEAGLLQAEIAKTPMGRMGTAEEVADTIAFLCSPLSSYICGAALAIDGGYTAQ